MPFQICVKSSVSIIISSINVDVFAKPIVELRDWLRRSQRGQDGGVVVVLEIANAYETAYIYGDLDVVLCGFDSLIRESLNVGAGDHDDSLQVEKRKTPH